VNGPPGRLVLSAAFLAFLLSCLLPLPLPAAPAVYVLSTPGVH
jgi:hypothetical protein